MTNNDPATPDPDAKLPMIALLGEFSAGKSTLANILLGATRSPVRVTATQAPPIWYVSGTSLPVHVAADGTETELPNTSLDDLQLHDTRSVRVSVQAEILDRLTLLDMPGSSDPNMSSEIWDTLLPLADIVIWCTPATQAWRQSEAAVWDMVPEDLQSRSLLLLTRIDKVAQPSDRDRIVSRVQREAGDLFRAVLPVSLLDVSNPPARCEASGMKQVLQALDGILSGTATEDNVAPCTVSITAPDDAGQIERIVPRRVSAQVSGSDRRVLRRPRAEDRTT